MEAMCASGPSPKEGGYLAVFRGFLPTLRTSSEEIGIAPVSAMRSHASSTSGLGSWRYMDGGWVFRNEPLNLVVDIPKSILSNTGAKYLLVENYV